MTDWRDTGLCGLNGGDGRDEGLCILNGRVGVVDRGCWCIYCVLRLVFPSIVSVLISNCF